MKLDHTSWVARAELEQKEQWDDIRQNMPWLDIPAGWAMKIIPPFGGATARFVVRNAHGVEISVYADHFSRLGVMRRPYWEAHGIGGPMTEADPDDPIRFDLNDTAGLLDALALWGDPVHAMKHALTKGET